MSILECAKSLGVRHNVSFRVIDVPTRTIVQEHIGHNAATDSMLTGIAHYLKGDGVLNQATHMLTEYVPKYISLGTMGLFGQDCDASGLPTQIGNKDYTGERYQDLTSEQRITLGWDNDTSKHVDDAQYYSGKVTAEESDVLRFTEYMIQCPGFGADGTDRNNNNSRRSFGLGYPHSWMSYPDVKNNCPTGEEPTELISTTCPRAKITYREIVPSTYAELDGTIDVIFSAMFSTGALKNFRGTNADGEMNDYLFITEAGLWSRPDYVYVEEGGHNGLLAGYRIIPTDEQYHDMRPHLDDKGEDLGKHNRDKLKQSILRVGRNQVVQVIWKIQLGALKELQNINSIYPEYDRDNKLYWQILDEQMRGM